MKKNQMKYPTKTPTANDDHIMRQTVIREIQPLERHNEVPKEQV